MWMPCNFGEKILLRRGSTYELEEAELVGLSVDIPYQAGADYCFIFRLKDGVLHDMRVRDTIAYWPHAFNNPKCYDINSLHEGEIDLLINVTIGRHYQYNKYLFNTKSRAEGECIGILKVEDGWKYQFKGRDALHKSFIVPDLLTGKPFLAYEDDPLLQ